MRKGSFIEATKDDVGMQAVPSDNSYTKTIAMDISPKLAGEFVIIRSTPFTMEVMPESGKERKKWREFVLVFYMGRIHRCLNRFETINNQTYEQRKQQIRTTK